jgi:transposase
MIVVISEITGVDSLYEIPDVIWNRIIPLLPPPKKKKNKKKKVGRPRMNDRKAMNAIFLCSTYWMSMECST